MKRAYTIAIILYISVQSIFAQSDSTQTGSDKIIPQSKKDSTVQANPAPVEEMKEPVTQTVSDPGAATDTTEDPTKPHLRNWAHVVLQNNEDDSNTVLAFKSTAFDEAAADALCKISLLSSLR